MKVLAMNGSPRKNGCTAAALRLVAEELGRQGIDVETVHVGNQPLHGCTACGSCKTTGKCVFDDAVNECIEKAKHADGILLGSPVYYSGIAGTMKSFLDRFFYVGPCLDYKVGASVVSARRAGTVDTFHQLNNYLNLKNVIQVPSQYWNAVHGSNAEEVMQDEEGVQIMRTLGKNMAWLMKVVENGKKSFAFPDPEKRVYTNFVR